MPARPASRSAASRAPRTRLSRVLAGADFSPPSKVAVARALAVAATTDAAVEVVHVLKHRRLLTPKDEALAESDLERFIAAVVRRERPPGLSSRLLPTEGSVAEALRAEAAELQAQLVVLGRTGRNLLRGMLLGSTTEKLARADERSLLVVHPESSAGKPYRKPLVPVDFSPEADRAMALCAALAPEAKRVDVLHVYDRSYALVLRASATGVDRVAQYDHDRHVEAERAMALFLSGHQRPDVQLVPHIIGGDPRPDIRDQAGRLGSDLIVAGRRGASANAPIGTTAEGLLRFAPTDLALTGRPTFTI